jgi:hypothetical protein
VRAAQALGHLPLIEGVEFDESEAIRKLMEALRANPDDRAVMEACLISLANLLTGPKALAALAALKGFDDIARILALAHDDPKLRDAALRALERAREAAELNPNLVDTKVLGALLKAAAGDRAQLRDFLKRMAMNGGAPALVRAFGGFLLLLLVLVHRELMPPLPGMNLDGLDIGADLLRALREGAAGMGMELAFADADALNALLNALRGGNKERQKEALRLLAHLGKDALLELARKGGALRARRSARADRAGAGIEALLKLMMDNLEDPEMVLLALNALNRMVMYVVAWRGAGRQAAWLAGWLPA